MLPWASEVGPDGGGAGGVQCGSRLPWALARMDATIYQSFPKSGRKARPRSSLGPAGRIGERAAAITGAARETRRSRTTSVRFSICTPFRAASFRPLARARRAALGLRVLPERQKE